MGKFEVPKTRDEAYSRRKILGQRIANIQNEINAIKKHRIQNWTSAQIFEYTQKKSQERFECSEEVEFLKKIENEMNLEEKKEFLNQEADPANEAIKSIRAMKKLIIDLREQVLHLVSENNALREKLSERTSPGIEVDHWRNGYTRQDKV